MDKIDGQSNQVTACLVSTEPGVYDNTSNIQHKVGEAYALDGCTVYKHLWPEWPEC